jgi:hypothetical protein
MSVTMHGIWICNWIYWTLTDSWLQITTALSLIHTLQFATARTKSLQFSMSSPIVDWWRIQQCPLLLCSNSYRLATVPQLTHCSNCRFSNNLLNYRLVLLITSQHGPRRKHSSVALQLLFSGPREKHHSSVVCRPLPNYCRCTVDNLAIAT